MKTLEQLNEIAENSGFSKIAIRVMTGGKQAGIGEEVENSFTWVDGEITQERLDGVSALDVCFDGWEMMNFQSALSAAAAYGAENQIVLIGSNSPDCYEGNDPREVVMPNATVIEILS